MTEYLVAIALSFGTAFLLRSFGLRSFEKLVDALSQLVGGWRDDGWPRGIQEEDPDRPWGRVVRALSGAAAAAPELRPALAKVRPVVRSR
jgi:hypothetical protein